MSLIYAYKGFGKTVDITISDSAGDVVTPGASDRLRVVICREGQDAILTINSTEATANGSSLTKGETSRLRLDSADLNFAAGIYSLSVEYMDAADDSEWKTVQRQVFVLEDNSIA
jgi:hypothetical protein